MADSFTFFLIQILNGVQEGLLLFLVASGLTLVFGIMGIINLAHGSFYMLGAYLAFALAAATGNLLVAIMLAIPLALAIGLALEFLLFQESRSLVFGDDVHGVAIPRFLDFSIPLTANLSYPAYRLAMSAVCLLVAGAMWLLIAKTRLGMAIRAGATNREMVQSLGIDIAWVYRAVFALGVALAAFAGMIAAPVASVFPGMGNQILIISFVVVVIGGIGSIKGAFLGSLLIGLADTFGQVLVPQLAGMTVYVLMAAVLVWRPAGLFGSRAA